MRRGLSRALYAFLVASIVSLSMPLQAGATPALAPNAVKVTLKGGNAKALAECLNLAKEKRRGDVRQKNECDNKAFAEGGDVVLKDVEIKVVQTSQDGGPGEPNTVTITIAGGDANALAECLNLAKERRKGSVAQQNKCENRAFARGGDVVLKNVDITVIQENGTAGGTVTITIVGGNASALAQCLNLVKERRKGNVDQENRCKNYAFARGGDVILENVEITVIQKNVDGGSGPPGTVTITIAGGDATALAECLNLAKEKRKGSVEQKNKCENSAVAEGGEVIMKDVEIKVIQQNV
jgi:hypothetical protein